MQSFRFPVGSRRSVLCAGALFLGAHGLGCNAITGADNFVIGENGSGGSKSSSTTNPVTGPAVGSTGAGSMVSGTGVGGSTPVLPVSDATGVSIRDIAFYQAVKSKVVSAGKAQTPSVSLIAGRPAVVRVFVDVGALSGGAISARLTIGSAQPIVVPVAAPRNSTDASFASTINFQVPAELMTVGMGYRVEIYEDPSTSQGTNANSHFPAAGLQTLTLKNAGRVKVTLIPIKYGADGSNRLPDTSAAQVTAYHDKFFAMYPTTSVDVTVGPTFAWSQTVDASGNGWDNLLSGLSDFRVQASGAATDEFYFGIFEPSSSFGQFCGGGCVAGLGYIGDPQGLYSRAAIGLGYSGDDATGTAVHEVGHNHGRAHSPCGGASSPDPAYPYAGGGTGAWGLMLGTNQLFDPAQYKDMMGYCSPTWISDYVYESILSFKETLQNTQVVFPPESLNQTYERVRVSPSGNTFMDPIVMPTPPLGGSKSVTVTTANGPEIVEGQFYAFDHLEGGVLFVKQSSAPIQSLDFDMQTFTGHKLVHAVR